MNRYRSKSQQQILRPGTKVSVNTAYTKTSNHLKAALRSKPKLLSHMEFYPAVVHAVSGVGVLVKFPFDIDLDESILRHY